MRNLSLSLLAFVLPLFTMAQDIIPVNQVILDTNIDQEVLYGTCTLDGVRDFHLFSPFYIEEYENYSPDIETLAHFQGELATCDITIVLGTWCDDSRMQVPRFIRILDEVGYETDKVTFIATDRKKNAPVPGFTDLGIERVPTFILTFEGRELGRIVETPVETLERDLMGILGGGGDE